MSYHVKAKTFQLRVRTYSELSFSVSRTFFNWNNGSGLSVSRVWKILALCLIANKKKKRKKQARFAVIHVVNFHCRLGNSKLPGSRVRRFEIKANKMDNTTVEK